MTNSPRRLVELLDELKLLSDPEFRSDLLIEYAARFQEVPEEIAQRPFPKQNRVPGCESEAYVWALPEGPTGIKLYFAVENPQGISAKALAVILTETLAGESAEDVGNVEESIVDQIFGKTVSMGKGQGLMNMVKTAKTLAAKVANK